MRVLKLVRVTADEIGWFERIKLVEKIEDIWVRPNQS